MHVHAIIAIRAAKLRHTCGAFASRRYAERMGIPLALYRIACQCEALEQAGYSA